MTEPLFDSAFLRKLDRLTMLTRRAMSGEMQGERRSPRRGTSVEFADFRPYTMGDDFRQIDWNLYARLDRFFLKLFVAEEELAIHLLIDNSASMDWGEPNKLDYARRAAGAFGYIALSSLDRVTVTAFGAGASGANSGGQQLPGVRGKRGALPLFHFLQHIAVGNAVDLSSACHRYMQTARTPGPLLLCSDLLDPGWQDALKALSSRPFEITVLHILAPQEIDPQIEGDFRLTDSEGGPAVEITADPDALRQYYQHLNEWRTEVETFCSGRSMTYLFVETSNPVEDFVLSQMRKRGVLR